MLFLFAAVECGSHLGFLDVTLIWVGHTLKSGSFAGPEGDKWARCQAFENYRDLIDAPNKPDAVIIGVPPDRHGEPVHSSSGQLFYSMEILANAPAHVLQMPSQGLASVDSGKISTLRFGSGKSSDDSST